MIALLFFSAAASSAVWTCDATYVVDGQTAAAERHTITIKMSDILKSKDRQPFSVKGTPGRSFDAWWIDDNSLMHLVEKGPTTPASLTIDEPLTDGHAAHADGKCRFKRTGA